MSEPESRKQSFSIVDVMKVRHDQVNPEAAVKVFELPDQIETVKCDVLVAGGGVGGVAAALSIFTGLAGIAAITDIADGTNVTGITGATDLKVCITEETDWLGGQMTSQGVPVLDEGRNFLIETSGANHSYQWFRERIRNYYRQHYKLSSKSAAEKYLNPGNCWDWVSQLAFEPQVAVKIIDELIDKTSSSLKIFLRCVPVKAECLGDRIERVLAINLDTGKWTTFEADIYIDATELGELLKLSGAKYVVGSEPQQGTGEPHAAKTADRENVQDYVFPFVVEFVPGTDNTIAKPDAYDEFNIQGKFSFHGYKMFECADKLMPFWTYRRILDKTVFDDARITNDKSVINWFAGNDFRGHNVIDKQPHVVSQYLSQAKALSISFLYWLQTEAPRDDGGKGYPEIKLQTNALGSEDGLSKYPYIREARRARAFTCIAEQDLTSDNARARIFSDSVGLGFFPVDIHGKDASAAELRPTKHFQIPLGAMLTEFPSNLVLACKNIGTTHITNGAYRLHPIEWAIGEAAGALACYAVQKRIAAHEVLQNVRELRSFQLRLIKMGVPLYWYDDIATIHPNFEAIQFLSITNIMQGEPGNLHFNPEAEVSQEQAEAILSAASTVVGSKLSAESDLEFTMLTTRAEFAGRLYSKVRKIL